MRRREPDPYAGYRQRLVEVLRGKGIHDLAVLKAVAEVPRHLFVPTAVRHRAYEDSALPIGKGQTISQPLVQALSLQALGLSGTERVLEVGTGSGYQTALLAHVAKQVFSIERLPELAEAARIAIRTAGVQNVSIMVGDGTLGWRPYAPYDGIVVSAGAPEVPPPLIDQLADGGRLVMPVGGAQLQTLTVVRRQGTDIVTTHLDDAIFVPLIGRHGV